MLQYPVYTYFKEDSSVIKSMMFKKQGKLHREFDKPALTEYSLEKVILSESWLINGELHREGDRPARILYKDDKVTSRSWYKEGKLHRVGEAALITYNPEGRMTSMTFYEKGVITRECDLPAVKHFHKGRLSYSGYYKDGFLCREVWHSFDDSDFHLKEVFHKEGYAFRELVRQPEGGTINTYFDEQGRVHRTRGAAITKTNKNGVKVLEQFYLHGKLHRDDDYETGESLPAEIKYKKNGDLYIKFFWKDGVKLASWWADRPEGRRWKLY